MQANKLSFYFKEVVYKKVVLDCSKKLIKLSTGFLRPKKVCKCINV